MLNLARRAIFRFEKVELRVMEKDMVTGAVAVDPESVRSEISLYTPRASHLLAGNDPAPSIFTPRSHSFCQILRRAFLMKRTHSTRFIPRARRIQHCAYLTVLSGSLTSHKLRRWPAIWSRVYTNRIDSFASYV